MNKNKLYFLNRELLYYTKMQIPGRNLKIIPEDSVVYLLDILYISSSEEEYVFYKVLWKNNICYIHYKRYKRYIQEFSYTDEYILKYQLNCVEILL